MFTHNRLVIRFKVFKLKLKKKSHECKNHSGIIGKVILRKKMFLEHIMSYLNSFQNCSKFLMKYAGTFGVYL